LPIWTIRTTPKSASDCGIWWANIISVGRLRKNRNEATELEHEEEDNFVLLLVFDKQMRLYFLEIEMDWSKLERERLDLELPLLIVKGPNGFLACAYIAVDSCNKTNEACAIVSGVQSHEDMLEKEVKAVSSPEANLRRLQSHPVTLAGARL
jgi:uncharacterized protein YunC (DUF1805 family)